MNTTAGGATGFDLDRLEAIAAASDPIYTDLYGDRYMQGSWSRVDLDKEQDAFITTFTPEAVRSLIDLARRATATSVSGDERALYETWELREAERRKGEPLTPDEVQYVLKRWTRDRDTYEWCPHHWPAFQAGFQAALTHRAAPAMPKFSKEWCQHMAEQEISFGGNIEAGIAAAPDITAPAVDQQAGEAMTAAMSEGNKHGVNSIVAARIVAAYLNATPAATTASASIRYECAQCTWSGPSDRVIGDGNGPICPECDGPARSSAPSQDAAVLRSFDAWVERFPKERGRALTPTEQRIAFIAWNDALAQQSAAQGDGAAVAAIEFALSLDDRDAMLFLRWWNEGEFDKMRKHWIVPAVPEAVFIGADPLHPATRAAQAQAGDMAHGAGLRAGIDKCIAQSNADDADRLNFLDTNVHKFRMGWRVGIAPVGNLSIQSIIMGGAPIREAIDAAMSAPATTGGKA